MLSRTTPPAVHTNIPACTSPLPHATIAYPLLLLGSVIRFCFEGYNHPPPRIRLTLADFLQHAIEGWTDSLRREVAPYGLHVSLIQPSFLKTPLIENITARYSEKAWAGADDMVRTI